MPVAKLGERRRAPAKERIAEWSFDDAAKQEERQRALAKGRNVWAAM